MKMNMICPDCGKKIRIDFDSQDPVCPYCGYDLSEEFVDGYNFEIGRIRAYRQLAREQARRSIPIILIAFLIPIGIIGIIIYILLHFC